MRISRAGMAIYGALALGLGAASGWPLDGPGAMLRAAGHAGFLFAALAVFCAVLPKRLSLPVQIVVAMLGGIGAGWLLAHWGEQALVTDYLGIFGTLFILLLQVVIIPLVFVSIVCGVAGIGDVRKLGALGAKTIAFYLSTTAAAVLLALVLVNVLEPGVGRESLRDEVAHEESSKAQTTVGVQIQKEVLPTIIKNPIMPGQSPIVVIFFALLLGAALAAVGPEAQPAIRVFQGLDKAFITIIGWIMALAPIGVFALMAKAISELGLDYVLTLGKYCFTVLLGLGLHFCLLTCVLCPLLGKVSARRFLSGMGPAFGVAFSTSSSSATLPVSIDCATRRVGTDPNITGFMLPIGATINMDGTALYVSVASLFIAQVYGLHLSFQAEVMVFLTAILVSVGTAGIPGASIGLISIILSGAGIPVEGIGFILGVDRILDMSRTVVNMTGDCVGAVVVSRSEGLMRDP
jgi:Na+/H+-dicarboxylate symporter